MKLYAPIGLQEVLSLKQGCYLQELSMFFGFARLRCGRCGLCLKIDIPDTVKSLNGNYMSHAVGRPSQPNDISKEHGVLVNPYKKRMTGYEMSNDDNKKFRHMVPNEVATKQHASEENMNVSKLLRRKAKWVFGELLYRCLVCGKADCNGEMCLNACLRCGNSRHNNTSCSFNNAKLAKLLPNKGVCFGCFDTRQHTMTNHDMKACPYKRRLKRLMFLDHERKGNAFDEYLRRIYCSELTFVSFVASYWKDTSLGRYVYVLYFSVLSG